MTTPKRSFKHLRRHAPVPEPGRVEGDGTGRRVRPVTARSYLPHYLTLAEDFGRQGRTWDDLAAHIGISREVLIHWMETNVDFRHAMYRARDLAKSWWEQQLRQQSVDGSTAATTFAMKNQFPDDYRDRREHRVEIEEVGEVLIDLTGYDEADDAEYEVLE